MGFTVGTWCRHWSEGLFTGSSPSLQSVLQDCDRDTIPGGGPRSGQEGGERRHGDVERERKRLRRRKVRHLGAEEQVNLSPAIFILQMNIVFLHRQQAGRWRKRYRRWQTWARTRRTTRTSRTPRSRSLTLSLWGTGTSPRLSLLWRIEPNYPFLSFHLQVQPKQHKITKQYCCHVASSKESIFWTPRLVIVVVDTRPLSVPFLFRTSLSHSQTGSTPRLVIAPQHPNYSIRAWTCCWK